MQSVKMKKHLGKDELGASDAIKTVREILEKRHGRTYEQIQKIDEADLERILAVIGNEKAPTSLILSLHQNSGLEPAGMDETNKPKARTLPQFAERIFIETESALKNREWKLTELEQRELSQDQISFLEKRLRTAKIKSRINGIISSDQ